MKWLPFLVVPLAHAIVNLVSILDHTGIESCLLKLFSLLKSSQSPQQFRFLFLITNSTIAPDWDAIMTATFPQIPIDIKLWDNYRPVTFPALKGRKFEQEYIFARFYLAEIFNVDKFLYIDNDVVITADLTELMAISMTGNACSNIPECASGKLFRRQKQAVAMVYEVHPQYALYMKSNFNLSHPIVSEVFQTLQSALPTWRKLGLFLNAGVFIVDTALWKLSRLTQRAEALMRQNAETSMFDQAAVGDQGVFYLLLGADVLGLPARWNLRRLPKKTMLQLEDGSTTGIVHFAGTFHGNAALICRYSTQYPLFLGAALPIHLSVVSAFIATHPLVAKHLQIYRDCPPAVAMVTEERRSKGISVQYNPGHGDFKWPLRE